MGNKKWYNHRFKIIYGEPTRLTCKMDIQKIEDGFVIGNVRKSDIKAIPVNSILIMDLMRS